MSIQLARDPKPTTESIVYPSDLSLVPARALIARGIDKAEELRARGAIVVVGASGALISGSRMDHGGAGGFARARSKAWIAATQQIPSVVHLKRLAMIAPQMASGFTEISPEANFPGAGGMPIGRDGAVVAGIAASGAGIGPFVDYPGAEPQRLIADGQPTNAEDLLVHYAIDAPYVGQHGDDYERWATAFGAWPADAASGTGMAKSPAASEQHELGWAMTIVDRALEEARHRELRITAAVVDRRGEPIQIDTMDGAPSAGVFVAEATAAAAAAFQVPSHALTELYPGTLLDQVAATLPFAILAADGGLPLERGNVVAGGLGIGGAPPQVCAEIAAAALAA
jgi:uncharacterized protein GlcG (DUF336 family)